MIKSNFILLLFLILFFSCNKDYSPESPQIGPNSPYDDPIWHPSGKLIAFNHKPIKEIHYNYGYDNPGMATYIYESDSAGFWIINADGTNKRRLLPHKIVTPVWSPDGNWIAYVLGGQIFKMPFNGNKLDTNNVQQLTFEDRNSSPSWSPDGEWISYSSNKDSPTGSKFIWKMRNDGSQKKRLVFTPDDGETIMPFWRNDFKIIHARYLRIGTTEIFITDSTGNENIRITYNEYDEWYPKTSPDNKFTCFISQTGKGYHLLRYNHSEKELKEFDFAGITNFSWSPEGEIVYLNFAFNSIDETQGTLWIMGADGTNQRQLTHNNFNIIQ